MVQDLLRIYPLGYIFAIDEENNFEPCEESGQHSHTGREADSPSCHMYKFSTGAQRCLAHWLLKTCPESRTIFFFPLWDPQNDNWFAGSLVWVRDPTRVLRNDSLNYLAAFGSCIMAEKARLDALIVTRAKSDFISLVSHELRSPLHSVLANAEALRETRSCLILWTICPSQYLLQCGTNNFHSLNHAEMSKTAKLQTPSFGQGLSTSFRSQ